MTPLRTWMIALERGQNFDALLPWLWEVIPELPAYPLAFSPCRVYLILPACRMAEVLPDPPAGIEVRAFDDPAVARRWIDHDIMLRQGPVVGRPS